MAGERDASLRAAVSALESEDLLRFLVRQRWFGRKGSSPSHARVADVIPLPWGGAESSYAIARVVVRDAAVEREFQLPIGLREGASAGKTDAIASVERDGQPLTLYDAVRDPDFRAKLAEALTKSGVVDAGSSRWVADVLRPHWLGASDRATTLGSAEQSNTSIIIGDPGVGIYKLFRVLTPGVHPDVEVTRFLTSTARFPHTPALLAETRVETTDEVITTGMLQAYLPGSSDAWSFALDRGRPYFAAPAEAAPKNDFVADARRLGAITRAMHDALASGTDPAFAPEPFRIEDLERQAHRVQQSIRESLSLLDAQTETGRIPSQRVAEARALVRRADHYAGFVDEIVDTVGDDLGSRIRTHGDYHLGQVLRTTTGDFMIIDFEGEPARTLEERRHKMSPLRDVAGMLRSFSYAAATMAAAEKTLDMPTRELRSARWERDVRAEYLAGFLAASGRAPLLPTDEENLRALVALFETEKAFYELSYELNNRPEWVGIPMKGIARLMQKSGH